MMILTLEENQISEGNQVIHEVPTFIKSLTPNTELYLLFKSLDTQFHTCPIRKTVPFLKSAEFTPDHWVAEKGIAKKQTLIAGVLPSPFMREVVSMLAEKPIAVRGTHVWDDVVVRTFGVLPNGWVMILHEHHVFVCLNGILTLSRPCYTAFSQELSAILRYLKRFGYEAESPLTLLSSSPIHETLPPFIHVEVRSPPNLDSKKWHSDALTIEIANLKSQMRLYRWPQILRRILLGITLLTLCSIGYLAWDMLTLSTEKQYLKLKIAQAQSQNRNLPSWDTAKLSDFAVYQDIPKDSPNPLKTFEQLVPLLKEEAVATHLHWSPDSLNLHLVFNPTSQPKELLLTLSSQMREFHFDWKAEEKNMQQGVLTLSKKSPSRSEIE